MEENLTKVIEWASRGTLRQFRVEAEARLMDSDYSVQMEDGTLVFYKTSKQGGFLGIGGKEVTEPVMKVVETENGIEISEEPLDPEFVAYLASGLQSH